MRDAKKQSAKQPKCQYRHNWTRNKEKQIICKDCKHLPNASEMQEAEAITHLRETIKPGETVYTVLRHVSRSGMSRGIDVYTIHDNQPIWITSYVGHAIGQPQSRKDWEQSNGLRIGGCGMDMGFHVVDSLSAVLYGRSGYKCLGKGKCPSNYHVNHRDRVRCEGVEETFRVVFNDEHGREIAGDTFKDRQAAEECVKGIDADLQPHIETDRRMCWQSDTMRRTIDVDGVQINAGHLYTVHQDDGTEEVCPTCKGEGYLPNPEGPERFDLVHTDSYALRHKWM